MNPEVILTHLDILVALVALTSAVKSSYNGWIRGMINNIQMIPEIHEKTQEMEDTQGRLVDATVALSIAEADEQRSVDPKEVENALRESGGVRDYLQRNGQRSSPYSDVEDEEEIPEEERRWRSEYDD